MGLVDDAGAPKLCFYAVEHVDAARGSRPPAVQPALDMSIDGTTQDVDHLLMSWRDGSYVLAVARKGVVEPCDAASDRRSAPAADWSLQPAALHTSANGFRLDVRHSVTFVIFRAA